MTEEKQQENSDNQIESTENNETTDTVEKQETIEDLAKKLQEAEQKAEHHWDNLLRKQAEYDNLQKRTTRDLENAHKYALEKFAIELLSIKDTMELGLEAAQKPETTLDSVCEGMNLTLKMLMDTMSKFNIVELDPADEKFDPQQHEAMSMQTLPNVEDGTILHVHQKGYKLHDRLLRPARVIVAKAIDNQG
jgi:molecular chaperone GrpE